MRRTSTAINGFIRGGNNNANEDSKNRRTSVYLLKAVPKNRYIKLPILMRLIRLCEDIREIYKKRIIPSEIYNYIYFSSCLYFTFKRDIELLYKLNINTTTGDHTLFKREFLLSREKEENEFGSKLYGLFIECISVLQETAKYHLQLQQEEQLTARERRTSKSFSPRRKYRELRDEAKRLRSEITNIVFSWRRLVDVKLSEFGRRTTKFIPKKYLLPLDMKRVDLGLFASRMLDVSIFAPHKFDMIKDFIESGEDNAGGISYYLYDCFTNQSNTELYEIGLVPRNGPPELKSIGPFQVVPLEDPSELFSLTVAEKVQVEERCHLSLTFMGKEVTLSSSKLSKVNLSPDKREYFKLPTTGKLYYCFIYPFSTSVDERDPLLCFSGYGGFIYFDERLDRVVAASALVDISTQEEFFEKKGPPIMSFSFPVRLEPTRYDASLIMFHRCNFISPNALKEPIQRFAWVNAGELGFDNTGCFVFEDSAGRITYFNLIGNQQGQFVYEAIKNDSIQDLWKNFIPEDTSVRKKMNPGETF